MDQLRHGRCVDDTAGRGGQVDADRETVTRARRDAAFGDVSREMVQSPGNRFPVRFDGAEQGSRVGRERVVRVDGVQCLPERDAGSALLGIGVASGENRAVEAARAAISSPLLEASIDGATGVLFNITGGPDLTLMELNEAARIIYEAVDPDAQIIFGSVTDERLEGEVRITVVATGFSSAPKSSHESEESGFSLSSLKEEISFGSPIRDLDLEPAIFRRSKASAENHR